MKFLHTSDWHLGAGEGERKLVEDQKFFIDEICGIIAAEDIDVVVISGDVYDRSVASADAVRLYDYAMNRMCMELGREVIVVAGNHDSAERLADCRSLLQKAGLHVLGALEREPVVISKGNTDFYLMPWFTVEKVKSLFPECAESIATLTDAYKTVCDNYRLSFAGGRRHVAVSHAFITNASLSESDRSAGIAAVGTAQQVDANVFEGFDYVALGHIHGPQSINDTVRYSGTPMIYSFGREEKQEKSVTVVDTDSMERKVIPVRLLHKWTTLSGTYDELMAGDYPEEVRTGFTRINVTDIYIGLEAIAGLKSVYPEAMDISGKAFESEDAGIRLTLDEFRELESNPNAIFASFCRDVVQGEPSEHIMEMFRQCVEEVSEE